MPTDLLILGAGGMLGRTLTARLAGRRPVTLPRAGLDLGDPAAVDRCLRELRPKVVVNCAGFTAVDRCESESDEAFRTNALGVASLAGACFRTQARLIHFSTDYIFSGDLDRPYHEWDAPGPRTVYGASKLAGEQAIRDHCPDHLILRTSWLYGVGGPSFVHTIHRLATESGPPLRVVNDQLGNPTSCRAVADRMDELLEVPATGSLHLSCSGEATWHDFAATIIAAWSLPRVLLPCTTAEYPRPAPRPMNSRLEKRGLRLLGLPPMPDWRDAFARFRSEHPDG